MMFHADYDNKILWQLFGDYFNAINIFAQSLYRRAPRGRWDNAVYQRLKPRRLWKVHLQRNLC